MLSRCLYGAQLSVIIGLSAAALATLISVVVGIVTGYLGGKVDMVAQRFVDAWMSFPDLIILIVVVSVLGPGMPQIIGTLGLLLGIGGSRIIRSAVVSVRENMYVHAAQSIGASHAAHPVAAHPAQRAAADHRAVHHPRRHRHPGRVRSCRSWASACRRRRRPGAACCRAAGRTFMFQGPWLALAPGLCLTVVVYATNVFGDALRDLLDPRMRGSR